jgi:cytochrome d ubiquinol oxidase subunit II
METLWFGIVCFMFTTYVVLDGFDFGAGILHLFVAKTDEERRTVLAAIGPLWDGNEVWLLAGGGVLFFSFPRAYAASFSGFYLPLMMVLWLLVGRGLSIEFRNLETSPLWRSAWDGGFFVSSALMAIVLGAAFGNVVRGVPLEADGFFSGPLFTNFLPSRYSGVLDWYTVVLGVFALVVLAMHGANFLRMKTEGRVRERASALGMRLWPVSVALGLVMTGCTYLVQPKLFEITAARPLVWPLIVLDLLALVAMPFAHRKASDTAPFATSTVLIASSLATAAMVIYPTMLRSTIDPAYDLTVSNAAAGSLNLRAGLWFWLIAIVLAAFYVAYLFRTFRGKVKPAESYGH